ncbi:ABC transporter substrate-binding protein [Acidovorax kalamii]|uniref:ABC transporter substrate-binding protein n=1 Tax=Acidovorax kalamii TaxID=2004485 RepID=UPI002091BEA1|nr:ABC transporter substrate-binding protein [Acidovorax kalamii]MCO5355750.1 ABC transporter substrate-binding protein [Acidovorax kalamii]
MPLDRLSPQALASLLLCALAGAMALHPAQAQPAKGALAPIQLGTTAPFSGAFAEYGQEYRKGADACLAAANATGGVRGRAVQITYLDDGYDPARAVANARTLAGQGIAAFVNLVGTGTLQALQPVLADLQVPVIGASSGAQQLRQAGTASRWVFHTKASNSEEFEGFARMLPTIGMEKVALVYQDNPFGRAGLDSALKAFATGTGRPPPTAIALDEPAAQGDAHPFATTIAQVRSAQPQVVVLIAAGQAAPAFIAAYQQAAGPAARVAVLNVVGGRVLTDQLQARVAGIMTSMLYPSPWSTSRRVVRDYQASLARTEASPSLLSLEGCINLRFALEALKAAGDDASPAGVRRALERGLTVDLGDFTLSLPAGKQVASRYTSLGIYRSNGRIAE